MHCFPHAFYPRCRISLGSAGEEESDASGCHSLIDTPSSPSKPILDGQQSATFMHAMNTLRVFWKARFPEIPRSYHSQNPQSSSLGIGTSASGIRLAIVGICSIFPSFTEPRTTVNGSNVMVKTVKKKAYSIFDSTCFGPRTFYLTEWCRRCHSGESTWLETIRRATLEAPIHTRVRME